MNYYVITDIHFGHKNITEFDCRKEDWEQHFIQELYMIPDDSVIIVLGDVAFKDEKDYHAMLRKLLLQKTILILGNHDKRSLSWYYNYWDCVCHSMKLNIFGKEIVFSHKPVKIHEHQTNMHGHFHNKPLDFCLDIEPELKKIYTDRHIALDFGIHSLRKIAMKGYKRKIIDREKQC